MHFSKRLQGRSVKFTAKGRIFPLWPLLMLVVLIGIAQLDVRGEGVWNFEGELQQELSSDLDEGFLETETYLDLEFEMGEGLEIDAKLSQRKWGEEDSLGAADIDLEVFPDIGELELSFYLETVFDTRERREFDFGFEGEAGGVDYDLGMEIDEENKTGFLSYYKRFSSGVSLRGEIELEDGYRFLSNRVRVRGLQFPIGDEIWEVSGEVDAGLGSSIFIDDEFLETSISLENETVRRMGLVSSGHDVSFYRLELLPEGKGQSELVQIILHNGREEPVDLAGWSIRGSGVEEEISADQVLLPGENLTIHLASTLIDERKPISLVDPRGVKVDDWSFPRFVWFEDGLFQREAVLERDIEVSFENGGFEELVVDWAGEITTGDGDVIYGGLGVDHLGTFRGVEMGYVGNGIGLDIDVLDREVSFTWNLVDEDMLESEMELSANVDGEIELEFQTEGDLNSLELENTLNIDSSPDGVEVDIEHQIEWKVWELEVAYAFAENGIMETTIESSIKF